MQPINNQWIDHSKYKVNGSVQCAIIVHNQILPYLYRYDPSTNLWEGGDCGEEFQLDEDVTHFMIIVEPNKPLPQKIIEINHDHI